MSGRGERSSGWAKGLDPSTALTVGEAARLAGVSEATLRKRIQSGRLLHEVGRRGGREVQLVRLVDLADVYPVLAGRDPDSGRDPVLCREPAASATEGAGSDTRPTTEPTGGSAPGDAQEGGARQHAFEVRLASLQVGNDGLGAQVRDLQLQRDDLKTQCNDLRDRLTTVERERQAGTAGLLLAQRRLLELEGAGPVVQLGPAWWRRSSTWGLAVVFVLVGGTMGIEIHESRTARAAAREDASELEGRLGELAHDLDEVQESGARALEQLASEREAWNAERQTLEQRGSAGEDRVAELDAHLQVTREAAQEDRRLLEESLAEAKSLTSSVQEELTREREESRAERARTAELLEERERVAAAERRATAQALAELGQRAEASAEAAEALTDELAESRVDEQERTALLLTEIERLGTLLPATPPAVAESVPDWDPVEDERARRWLFGLHLPGMLQTPTEGGR